MAYSVWDENPYAMLGIEAANQISQLAANELNYKATKQTNATNKAINESSIAANREMLELQQAYNSPLVQRQMLKAAGYSPAALLGSSGYHSISSALGIPSSIGMQAPHFSPVESGHGIARFAQAKASAEQATVSAAEANLKKIDSETRSQENSANIRALQKKGDLDEQEADFYNWKNTLNQSTFNEQVQQITQDAYKKRVEADRENVQLSRDDFSLTLFKKFGEKEYQKKLQQIDADIRYVLEKAKTEKEQRAMLDSLAYKYRMEGDETDRFNKYFDDVRDYRLNQEKLQGYEAQEQFKFDVVNLKNMLYADLDNKILSVKTAQMQLNMLQEQYDQLVVHGSFQEATEISNLIMTWSGAIRNASAGQITPKDKARMMLETDRLELQREKFDFERSRTKRKVRKNLMNGDWLETERFVP